MEQKYRIEKQSDGSYRVSEEDDFDIIAFFEMFTHKEFWITILVIAGLALGIYVHYAISDAYYQNVTRPKQEAETARQIAQETSLWDMKILDKSGLLIHGDNTRYDNSGNEYTCEYWEFCSCDGDETYMTMDLDGINKYSKLKGTIFTRPEAKPELGIIFSIIGDGKELYNSGMIDSTTRPQNLNINISGIKRLTITAVAEGRDWTNPAVVFANARIYA